MTSSASPVTDFRPPARSVLRICQSRWLVPVLVVTTAGFAAWLLTAPRSNADLLKIAYSYSAGGYCALTDTGVPEDIYFDGVRILRRSRDGSSYCCGFTFLIAIRVAEQRGLLKNKAAFEVARFQQECYGTSKSSAERQLVMALENLKIGKAIRPGEARPGDFIVYHRNFHSGHSAIFLDWLRRDGGVIGFKFRSSQNWTLGVADDVEYFVGSGHPDASVDPNRFYVGRLD